MAVASGPAGPVLAGPVYTVIFGTAHAQIINNDRSISTTGSIADSTAQDDIPEKSHQQVN